MVEEFRESMVAYLKENGYDEKSAKGWFKLGGALFDEDRYEEAAYTHQQSVAIDPTNPHVWKDLGATLFLINQDYRDSS